MAGDRGTSADDAYLSSTRPNGTTSGAFGQLVEGLYAVKEPPDDSLGDGWPIGNARLRAIYRNDTLTLRVATHLR
jgi:hypothetical protein